MVGHPVCSSNTSQDVEHLLTKLEGPIKAVAFDCEFSGCKIPTELDSVEDGLAEAVQKKCRVAEAFEVLQWGITLVEEDQGTCRLSTYSFYVKASDDETTRWSPEAVKFLAEHRFDFQRRQLEGLRCLSREQERALREAGVEPREEDRRLLRVWEAIVARRLPVVVHGPLDLLFLLRRFEAPVLPRAEALSALIGRCFERVYDLAHLSRRHDEPNYAVDTGCCMGLWDFLTLTRNRSPWLTVLGAASAEQRHDAGGDAAATAEAYLRARSWLPQVVESAANCLFLYRHDSGWQLKLGNGQGASMDGAATCGASAHSQELSGLDPVAVGHHVDAQGEGSTPGRVEHTETERWLAQGLQQREAPSCSMATAPGDHIANTDRLVSPRLSAWLGDCAPSESSGPSTRSGSPLSRHTEAGSSPGGAGHTLVLDSDAASVKCTFPSGYVSSSSSAVSGSDDGRWPHVPLQRSESSASSGEPLGEASTAGNEADAESVGGVEDRASGWSSSQASEAPYWPPGDWTSYTDTERADIRLPHIIDAGAWSPMELWAADWGGAAAFWACGDVGIHIHQDPLPVQYQ